MAACYNRFEVSLQAAGASRTGTGEMTPPGSSPGLEGVKPGWGTLLPVPAGPGFSRVTVEPGAKSELVVARQTVRVRDPEANTGAGA